MKARISGCVLLLGACVSLPAEPASGQSDPISVCVLAEGEEGLVGQKLIFVGRMTDISPHGRYVWDEQCPDLYMLAYPARGLLADRSSPWWSVAVRSGGEDQARPFIFEADVVKKDYLLSGTNHHSMRTMLEVTDIFKILD